MDATTQTIAILIIVFTLAILLITTQFIRRRGAFPIRVIPLYEHLPLMIGTAIEANQPVHLSLGSAGLGGNSTLLTLASAELFYHAAHRASVSSAGPFISLSNASAIPLAYDTLRRAYEARKLKTRFGPSAVRWYPSGPRSLAFAAGVTALQGDDNIGANILVGSFGPELALIADAAYRRDQSFAAASTQLDGQAIAYAFSDKTLIGEEIFTAGAYLSDKASHKASLVTIDWLRIGLIIFLLLTTLTANNSEFAQFLGSLLSRSGGN